MVFGEKQFEFIREIRWFRFYLVFLKIFREFSVRFQPEACIFAIFSVEIRLFVTNYSDKNRNFIKKTVKPTVELYTSITCVKYSFFVFTLFKVDIIRIFLFKKIFYVLKLFILISIKLITMIEFT